MNTYVYMPDTLLDVIGPWSISQLSSITADDVVPYLVFEIPNGAGEKAGSDQIQQARRGYEEVLQLRASSTPNKG